MTTFVSAYAQRGDRWIADKDPDDIDNWGVSIADILAENPTATVVSITPLTVGVAVQPGEVVQQTGTDVYVLMGGGDASDAAALDPELNRCTFRILLSNKVQRDKTIYFRMVNN